MKVAVVGEIFSPNLGDGVIFECIRHLFAARGVEVVALDFGMRTGWSDEPAPPAAPEAGGVRRAAQFVVRRSRLVRRGLTASRWYLRQRRVHSLRWERVVRECDAVVIGGGHLLVDIGFTFAPRIAEIVRLAEKHGKPVAFFACGAGSRWGRVATRIYGHALNYASYVSVRDHVSAAAVRKVLKPGREVVVHADPGFATAAAYPPAARREGATVGFGAQPVQHIRNHVPELRDLDERAYHDFWAAVGAEVEKTGATVELFSNGTAEDQAEAESLHRHLTAAGLRPRLAPRPRVPAELVERIGGYDALLCTRMHAGIVGFSMGARVVPISWDRKVDNVWDFMGRGEAVLAPQVFRHPGEWAAASPRGDRAASLGSDERARLHSALQDAADTCLTRLGLPRGARVRAG